MRELKKLPLGIEDFVKIRKEGFYYIDKTGLIKELLNTDTAKKIAKKRQLFMEQFLEEFYAEWNGEC